jgi:transcriptional regulator with XRE-family HTH domain
MPNQPRPQGPTAERVARAVRALRHRLGLDLANVSNRLAEVGWPIALAQLSKLERGERRVDVDDLTALALVLDVTPARLLLDAEADAEPLGLTPSVTTTRREAWQWLAGEAPLPKPREQGEPLDLDRLGAWCEANAPHVERAQLTLEEVEGHLDVLAPVASAARTARDAGVSQVDIEAYLRLVANIERAATR